MTHQKNIYCISDIHNDYDRFRDMLRKIHFSSEDTLYILGDIFDRNEENPKPVQLYQYISAAENIKVLIGNHDRWLANDIKADLAGFRKRWYDYNTFEILEREMTAGEREKLAGWIDGLPRYMIIECAGNRFMLAHAITSETPEYKSEHFFTMGEADFFYMKNGIPDYVSVIGHMTTDYIRFFMGEEREKKNTIWVNEERTVFAIDCGCGFGEKASRLACLRLNDFAVYYI